MKQKLPNSFRLRAFLLTVMLVTLCRGTAWGEEAVYKTALFGSSYNSKSVNDYTSTWTSTNSGFTVSLTNFNNNQNGWNSVKCGRKNTDSTGTITTSSSIDKAITKITLNISNITASKVTSIKLYTSSNGSSWTSAGTYTKSTGSQTVNISSPTANLYYKLEFVCTSGSSNGLVEISQIDFYYDAKSDPSLSVSPTSLSLGYGETKSFTVSKTSDGDLTVESEDTDIATVAEDGETPGKYNVTYVGEGSTSITVSTSETTTYESDSKEVTVTTTDGRSAADIAFASVSQSAVIAAGTSFKQDLTNPNSLSVSYSSTNTDVATVASDGTVTLKTAGSTTIKATFDGNASYKPAEVSYTLTVTDKYVADLEFEADEVEKLTTDAPFTNAIVTDPDPISVIYSSTNTSVATVDFDGEVTIAGAGTTTIKATINDASYEATEFTYTLTVNKADAPLSFSPTSVFIALDETESFVAPTLSNPQSLTIVYSSTNTSVASVDAGTGTITFNAVGETTIKATSAENATYKSGEISYTLTVTKVAETLPFSATFASSLGDFTVTQDATLGNLWAINNSSAKASAYISSTNNDGESWLISPYINITSAYATLSFQHAGNYFEADANMETEATLWIREKDSSWNQLTISTYPTGVNTKTKSSFVSTSNGLSSYSGKKVQIGLKYLGNTTSAGSWWVKNFRVADDREEAPISFASATVYELLKNKDTCEGQALTNDESLTVSYTSSNTDVATVNASTGVVTIRAVGETNITATYAETASYKGNTATYKLVVTSKAAAEIEYAEDATSQKITLGTYTHTLTNPHDLTIAYTSSDETVATVNVSTGEVTMLKVGSTTITATFTENEDYDGATASYTLTVIKDDAVLSFAKSNVNAGLADGTYQQVVTKTPADLPVTYSSSNENVGTVAADGTVTLLKNGSTTITANFAGNASYNSANASYTLYVVIDYTTLPFSYNDGYSSIGTNLTSGTRGLMQSGLGSDYSAKNSKLKFDGTGDYVILKYVGSANVLSYNITNNSFSGGTFKVQYSIDGSDYIDLKSYSSITSGLESLDNIPASARYIKWIYTNKSSGNVGLGNISLNECEPITIGSAGYTTHVTSHKVSMPASVTAYIATAAGGSTVTLSTIENVPASTAIVLKAAEGSYKLPVITTTADDASANILLASDGTVTGDGSSYWALSKFNGVVGFNVVGDGVTIPAGKAYLDLSDSDVKGFLSFDFGIADGIETMENNGQWTMDNAQIFNLAGQRVSKAKRGLYIVNGKKVLVK